ncbi:SDR family NAD(P)-dependent oxidoreductase [Amycolatopsis benzoatilytica]|uniref:SDR family NAD(P)-dependent oxidoreductase n=1 Tax=Amycolatopsis benzoatilytica TaxID=346045 RepID=UPI0012B6978F|nr:SDR family NAD(P)-dependent oxidoreductase [Amycolatopsis benzoatilytica]
MEPIAVVGMAVRFPGSNDLGEFWRNLLDGRDCMSALSDDQILRAGEDPKRLAMPGYVRRRPRIDAPYDFDAAFFGLTPREAEIRDPQFRVFLEVGHAALEHSGQVPADFPGRIGVFAGAGSNRYASEHVEPDARLLRSVGQLAVDFNNDPDYFAASVAQRLGLTGPTLTVRTACSTSLVALHLARQALLAGDCELALVGGSMVDPQSERGFLHVPGGVNSADGSCRPFARSATGTNFGDGVGAIVLKRLSAALSDGDPVHAVVRGSMVNNDGGRGTGFTAPSADGQADCITAAFTAAGIDPRTISYFEAHGTGTAIGDRTEVAAMTQAFQALAGQSLPPGSCLLGSVKSNVGHLGAAAGVAGVIKTVLALHHERLPASINVDAVNPELGLAGSPFEVLTESRPWPRQPGSVRRACVNSFGIGGTNAHVILEEAPPAEPGPPEHREQVIVWSADDRTAEAQLRDRLRGYFTELEPAWFAAAAHTLQVGRTARSVRSAVVGRDREQVVAQLASGVLSSDGRPRSVGWYFPDESAWRPGLATGRYGAEPDFRDACDSAFAAVEPFAGQLRTPWLAGVDVAPDLARATLFVLQYAMATCLTRWGVRPDSVSGDGVGTLAAQAFSEGEISRRLAERVLIGAAGPQRTEPAADLTVRIGPGTGSAGVLPVLSDHSLNDVLATLWVHGQAIDWRRRGPRAARRIPVPGYPYQRRRHWVAYHGPATATATAAEQPEAAGWTLLHERWQPGGEVPETTVRGARALVLRPENAPWITDSVVAAGYHATELPAVEALRDTAAPDLIVHALAVAEEDSVEAQLETGLYSLLACVQTLAKQVRDRPAPATLAILLRNAVDLTGAEPLNPARSMLPAFARTVEREIPGLRCVLIDVGPVAAASALAAELATLTAPQVALRGRTRWLPGIVPVDDPPAEPRSLRENGIYLITGGLGGVGLVIARALAGTGLRPRLALLGRSAVGGPEVEQLEAAGATVAVIAADVTDPEALRGALAEVERTFGRGPHGVVHAAGVAGGGLIERRSRSDVDRVLRAKVHGTLALEHALAGEELDFLAYFSSHAGVSGLRGSADYAAANAFLNAHAAQHRLRHPRTLSIAWPGWERTGMTDVPGRRFVLTPGQTWQLDEHRFGDVPVLPATAMLDFVVTAARELALLPDTSPVGLRDTLILRSLPVTEPHVVEVAVSAAPGGHRFRLRAAPVRGPGEWTEHAEGLIEVPDAEPELADRSLPAAVPHQPTAAAGPGFGFGPRWESEVRRRRDGNSAVVELELPEKFHADLRAHLLHPALLDVAASALIDTTAEAVFVPFRYRSVTVFDRLTGRVTAHSRLREQTSTTRVVDVDLHDTTTGEHLVAIRSLTFRAVPRADFSRTSAATAPRDPRLPRDPQLDPAEGARIFLDLLGRDLPPAVIVDHAGAPSAPEPAAAEPAPPPTPAGRPVVEVVRQLWTDLLGNPDIGLDDDFFDVGGSSLAAVHIVDQIEQRYGIALSSGALFESATVRTIAATLTDRGAR